MYKNFSRPSRFRRKFSRPGRFQEFQKTLKMFRISIDSRFRRNFSRPSVKVFRISVDTQDVQNFSTGRRSRSFSRPSRSRKILWVSVVHGILWYKKEIQRVYWYTKRKPKEPMVYWDLEGLLKSQASLFHLFWARCARLKSLSMHFPQKQTLFRGRFAPAAQPAYTLRGISIAHALNKLIIF